MVIRFGPTRQQREPFFNVDKTKTRVINGTICDIRVQAEAKFSLPNFERTDFGGIFAFVSLLGGQRVSK